MDNAKKSTPGNFLAHIGLGMLTFLAWLAIFSEAWYRRVYGDTGFDSVIFALIGSVAGVDSGLIQSYLSGGLLPAVVCALAQGVLFYLLRHTKRIPFRPVTRGISLGLSLVLLVFSLVDIGFFQYTFARMQRSDLYETEYVDPSTVDIQFPEQKRNLIYIYVESMESSFLDKAQGGAMEVNRIPELTQLARQNVNFSHNESVGGLVQLPGITWSTAAMLAQTAGVPMVLPNHISDWYKASGRDPVFYPGITSLGDILSENGYYQALMMGCDSNYGGERAYAQTHGIDKIYDLYTGRQDGLVPEDYFAWWGFEDQHLFAYARQALTEISRKDQPFAFTLLTMDTHHIDGYTCALCRNDYPEAYDNVIACASRQIAAFVT